jgi:hypothetical protein
MLVYGPGASTSGLVISDQHYPSCSPVGEALEPRTGQISVADPVLAAWGDAVSLLVSESTVAGNRRWSLKGRSKL